MNKAGKISTLVVGTMAVVGTVYASVEDVKNRVNGILGIENTENVKNQTTNQTAEQLIFTAKETQNTDGDGNDPEKLSDGGTPSVTFDKNGKIATNTNPNLSQNDVKNFNQIPVNHAILPLIQKYITAIASDTEIHPTDKLKLERDAILLAHTMYNTEIKRVAVSDFQSRYGEYKENFEDFTSGSQSLAQAWKNITTLADAVANPQKVENVNIDEIDFGVDETEGIIAEKDKIIDEEKQETEALTYKRDLIKKGMSEKDADKKMKEKFPNVKFNNNWSSQTNAPAINYENLSSFK